MKNILIIVPPLELLGGVSGHYKGLQKYWKKNIIYFVAIRAKSKTVLIFLKAMMNIIQYFWILIFKNIETVVFNLSVKPGFFSKMYYIRIAKLLKKKIIVFIHGWDEKYDWMLDCKDGRFIINSSDGFIVLSNIFKEKLEKRNVAVPIFISTTKVDEHLLQNFDINKRKGEIKNFLFLSRVERSKGIFLSLEVFKLLQKDYPNLSFNIAGDGTALDEVKQYVLEQEIKNVHFHGRVQEEDLIKVFIDNDCFFLQSESEGMPAALLEAMAFGLPVITTPVGGIPNFFINDTMGIISDEKMPYYYYHQIKLWLEVPQKVKLISKYNWQYAKEHFYASTVARNLEKHFREIQNQWD